MLVQNNKLNLSVSNASHSRHLFPREYSGRGDFRADVCLSVSPPFLRRGGFAEGKDGVVNFTLFYSE